MSTVLNLSSATTSVNKALTRYLGYGDSVLTINATETAKQTTIRSAGTASNLYSVISANTVTASTTIRTRKNTANGGLSLSIGSSATGEFEDTNAAHNDSLVAADLYNYQIVTGGTGTSISVACIGTLFAATTNTVKQFSEESSNILNTASTTFYLMVSGDGTNSTTESGTQITAVCAGTLKNMQININLNSRTNTSTAVSRLNTANGALSISISSSATGIFEDTANSDTITVGDIFNSAITLGTTSNNLGASFIKYDFVTTDSTSQYTSGQAAGITVNASANDYIEIQGGNQISTPESNVQAKANTTVTLSKLAINITNNTIVGTSTLTSRVGAGAGGQSASVTGLTTGIFSDASGTDSITTTSEINTLLAGGAAGTSLVWRYVAMKIAYAAAATGLPSAGLLVMQAVKRASYF